MTCAGLCEGLKSKTIARGLYLTTKVVLMIYGVFGAYVAQFENIYKKFAIYVIQGTVKSICVFVP